MSAIRLVLDITKRDANVLFDRQTGIRMTFRKPLVVVPFISENMKRSITNGKVIDVDGVTGINVRPEFCTSHARVLELMKITPNAPITKLSADAPSDEVAEEMKEEEAPKEEEVSEEKPKAKSTRSKKETAPKEEEGEK